jgi:alkylhydroperoxidase/carboxymuconolactone decarboxylase family protein YurZ
LSLSTIWSRAIASVSFKRGFSFFLRSKCQKKVIRLSTTYLEVEEKCDGRTVLETKTKLLIAVGAAFVSQCQPCLKNIIVKSIDSGANEKEIAEAIGVARLVRKNAIMQIDRFASGLAEIGADGCAAFLAVAAELEGD